MKLHRPASALVLSALFVTTMTSSSATWMSSQSSAADASPGGDSALVAAARAGDSGDRASRSRTTDAGTFAAGLPDALTGAPILPLETVPPTTSTLVPPATTAPFASDASGHQSAATAASAKQNSASPTSSAPTTAKRTTNAPTPTTAAPTTQSNVAASASNSNVNDFLLKALNNERGARGLAPLKLDPTLSKMAQDWSAKMASKKAISHSGSGAPAGFNAFGENVLKASAGTSAASMHNLWLSSPGHRKQMLQPGFDRVGIAAVCVNGSVYATQTFGHTAADGEANLSSEAPSAAAQAPVSGGPSCG